MADDNSADQQQITAKVIGRPFPPGVSGNPNGRPKRKTLTELIHAKLDDTPEGWEKLVALVMYKLFTDKDKDLLKELWHYTDGMPVQKQVLAGDEDNPIKIDVNSALKKIYGSTGTNSTGEMPDDS